ncbi:MAG TPA: hypothetical protein PLN34_09755, partial [Alloprevotella sp.]|nr:hypothetical protein [Alloprevotella sp.]
VSALIFQSLKKSLADSNNYFTGPPNNYKLITTSFANLLPPDERTDISQQKKGFRPSLKVVRRLPFGFAFAHRSPRTYICVILSNKPFNLTTNTSSLLTKWFFLFTLILTIHLNFFKSGSGAALF